MKKTVSILIVLAMLLSMVPAAFAVEAASGTIEAVSGKVYSTDTWTAEADGVVTISVSSAEGVGYKVYINGETDFLGYDLTNEDTLSYAVKAGDAVYLEVIGRNPATWGNCDATIIWAFSFDAEGTLKDAYTISEQTITQNGDIQIAMIDTAEVTIVTVTPETAGVYTITVSDDALIGNYGGGDWYIYDRANVEHGTTLKWTCEVAGYWETVDVYDEETGTTSPVEQYISGQSLMLGIISDSETVTVNMEKTGDYVAPTTTNVVYENKATLSQFAVPADATIGSYVDVYGDTHTAVLGDDGYYHLDSAKGDILLVDMNYIFTLSDALKSERPIMYAYVTDGDGNTTRYDIGNAVLDYEAVCDANGYYPLTEDLIFFYDVYAGGNGIYEYCLSANYNPECAWMFACLTMTLPGSEDVQQGSGTEEDPYIISTMPVDLSMTVAGGEEGQVFYLYVAEKDGTIEIKDLYDNYYPGAVWLYVNDGDPIWLNESGIGAVKAGDSVLIEHYQANWMPNEITYEVTLQYVTASEGGEGGGEGGEGGGEGGGDTGDDTDELTDTVSVTDGDVYECVAAMDAGEYYTIYYTPDVDGFVTFDISNDIGGWEIHINDEAYDFDEGKYSDIHTSPVSTDEPLIGGTTYVITINGYDNDSWVNIGGTLTFSITFNAVGSGSDVEISGELVDGNNYLELPLEADEVAYSYTATQTGTLHFVVTSVGLDMYGDGVYEDDTDDITNDFSYSTALTVDGQSLPYYYFGSIDVVEGETYIFTWADINEYFDWGWDATLNLSYTDELLPKVGTEELPVELHFEDCPTNSIEIPAGERAHYTLVGFTGTHFTIKGVGAYAVVVTTEWDMMTGEAETVETTYKAEKGVVTVPVTSHYFDIQIGNSSTVAAVFELDADYPLGSMEKPDTLELGTNTAEVAEGSDGYYFTWVAESDGVLTITVDGQYWNYCVTNYGAAMEDGEGDNYGDWHLWSDDPAVASEEWEVKAGDIIVVTVSTYDPENYDYPADTITVTASFEASTEPDVLLGDVNDDGKIDTVDAFFIVAYYNKVRTLTDDQLAAADVDKNGRVDTVDAYYIVALYNKVITALPGAK